jgi:hypothetical protein
MMNDSTPTTTKEIPAEGWEDWCDTFTNGNRGRSFNIDLVDDEMGDERLIEGLPLVAIDYDPADKGDDFVVTFGDELAPTSYVIPAPARLWQAQDANGLVVALEIEDESGRRTILSF